MPTAEAARGATTYAVCLCGSLAPRGGKHTGEQLQPYASVVYIGGPEKVAVCAIALPVTNRVSQF